MRGICFFFFFNKISKYKENKTSGKVRLFQRKMPAPHVVLLCHNDARIFSVPYLKSITVDMNYCSQKRKKMFPGSVEGIKDPMEGLFESVLEEVLLFIPHFTD